MALSLKLAAVAASTAVLIGGAAATAVTAGSASHPAAIATPSQTAGTEVRVVADAAAHLVSLPEPTVAAALAAAEVQMRAGDRLSHPLDATLAAGETVTVDRVIVTRWTRTVPVDFAIIEKKDASLEKGKTRIQTPGVPGERVDSMETVTVNATIESQNVVSSTVTREPVGQVVLVGTKPKPAAPKPAAAKTSLSGTALNLANAAMWDRIAQCESSGNWSINTGNGYYGGLQFNLGTWQSVNGQDFAAYPHQASREEQITVANRLYALRGLQPWGCRSAA